jgi:pyrroloquinoline quinone biosynthesis protein B
MIVRVLGSAAGGGFPQWNCGCANCVGQRNGKLGPPRTQASCAFSIDGARWFIIGCSPDIRAQIEATPALWPRAHRDTPIAGILLPNGDIDNTLGLLNLRESQPLHVYATAAVWRGFVEGNSLYRTLERQPDQVTWHELEDRRAQTIDGFELMAISVPGKLPPHLRDAEPDAAHNVAFVVRAGARAFAWLPTVAAPSTTLAAIAHEVDVLFFDGTFFTESELDGLSARTARQMSHWPLGGEDGSLEFLSELPCRRVLVHINNTNPILDPTSDAHARVLAAGVEIAHDGFELSL